MSRRSLEPIVRLLRDYCGEPEPASITDPLELILWENVAYLVDDQKRKTAFALLKKCVGTAPEALLSAPESVLLEVAKVGGMFPEQQVRKLRTIAELVLSRCDGDLTSMLDGSIAQAKKVLRQFPGIGEPGAEKILLFSRKQAVLALDSNGLRVLLRLGFGEEGKSYQASYRAVQSAVVDVLGLLTHWRWFGEWSLGCIGVLSDWLVETVHALCKRGETTLTIDALQKHTLPPDLRARMEREARAGEFKMDQAKAQSEQELQRLLGNPAPVPGTAPTTTRTLSPRNGVLRFPAHSKRKTRPPVTSQRWAMEKTIWEAVGGERK